MEYPKKIIVTPSKTGNGFIKGEQYIFVQNGSFSQRSYTCRVPHPKTGIHMDRISNYDTLTKADPSAHLWDGNDWEEAGHFELIKKIP